MSKLRPFLVLTVIAATIVTGTAHAALTTPSCLAKKRQAAAKLQHCRGVEEAKALQAKPADAAKCTTKFQAKIAAITEKASDAAIPCRFADNGDGTVIDYDTGLQWEQKNGANGVENAGNPHDVDNDYSWNTTAGGTAPNGTVFTDFLAKLNTCTAGTGFIQQSGFAFHCDWRLPSLAELQSILVAPAPCGTNPCIDPIFGPTKSGPYWTATTYGDAPDEAWIVHFSVGAADTFFKDQFTLFARAVRGGW